jgi:predicted transcriptional regulator
MGSRSSRDILENITSALRDDGGKSIKEIVNESGAQRNTVTRYLDSLQKQGLVEYEKEGRKKVYYISDEYLDLSEKAKYSYFGLKVDEETRNAVSAICNSIQNKWKEKTGRKPKKTEIQKTLAKVNDMEDLGLPIGWYMYGEMSAVVWDPETPFDESRSVPEDSEVMDSIEEVVDENTQFDSVAELMEHRYKEKGKDLYIAKHNLKEDILPNNHPKSEVMPEIYRFAYNLPDIEDEESKRMVDEFVSIFSTLYDKDDGYMRSELISLFDAVWRLVALYNFRNDLRDQELFSEKELEIKFRIDIHSQKQEVREKLERLQDFMPEPVEEEDELSELRGIASED